MTINTTTDTYRGFKVGDRVILTEIVDVYPTIVVKRGETGTITTIPDADKDMKQDQYFMVRLDVHHPELDEWDNDLEIWMYDEMIERPDEFPIPFQVVED